MVLIETLARESLIRELRKLLLVFRHRREKRINLLACLRAMGQTLARCCLLEHAFGIGGKVDSASLSLVPEPLRGLGSNVKRHVHAVFTLSALFPVLLKGMINRLGLDCHQRIEVSNTIVFPPATFPKDWAGSSSPS